MQVGETPTRQGRLRASNARVPGQLNPTASNCCTNGRIFVPESLQERLSRQFCMLSATLVDCECDLETIQELERSYKLSSYSGEKGSISQRLARRK